MDYAKAFDCVDHNKVENSSRDGNTTWSASWEICTQVKKPQLERDMEQQICSILEKKYKAVYCYPACLTYMQSTSCEMPV